MKKLIIIPTLVLSLIILTACSKEEERENTKNNDSNISNETALIQECPDEKIINKMPQIIDDSDTSNETSPRDAEAYYIFNGERKEISEFDEKWVEENCEVPEMEVF